MSEEILKALYDWNPWMEGKFPKELAGFSRSYSLGDYLKIPEIKILEGARRVGKSTLLYQIIEKLLKKKKNVLYINFEDEVLKKYSLSEVLSAFLKTWEEFWKPSSLMNSKDEAKRSISISKNRSVTFSSKSTYRSLRQYRFPKRSKTPKPNKESSKDF